MALRAYASEDKIARREVILEAARVLFVSGGGTLPSAAQIATAAGLAKGTVYLYFRTKEEIFAALLLAGWGAVMIEVGLALRSSKGKRGAKVAAFISAYATYLDEHPELLSLDALGYGVLEQNMGADSLRTFKIKLIDGLTEAGNTVDLALHLPGGRGFSLLMRTYALTRGLWQSTQRSEVLGSLTAEPALAQLYPVFREELRAALKEYWRGALMVEATPIK